MLACFLIVGYACVAHQGALLPHVLSRVICYQVLCPAAAVLIGLLLSGVRQRYIVYPLMVIFGLSETEWLQTTTLYVHVHNDHIERAWAEANQRLTDRFGLPPQEG